MSSKTFFLAVVLLGYSATGFAAAGELRVEQGWTKEVRERAYHEYHGSQILPLKWFLALESASGIASLLSTMPSFGLLTGEAGALDPAANPWNLPMGLTAATDLETAPLYGEKDWVGINCSACHTGMLEINGRKLVVDGGANMFDFEKFQHEILASVKATLADEAKFERFRSALNAEDAAVLKGYLGLFDKDFSRHVNINRYVVEQNGAKRTVRLGPERMDGIGLADNTSICNMDRLGDLELQAQISLPENCRTLHPPTGVPHLWGTFDHEYTHFANAIHSSLGRNVGTGAGVLSRNWVVKSPSGAPILRTTAHFRNLVSAENNYKKLLAPLWKDLAAAGYVAPLDPAAVARGREIYPAKNCQSCHALQPEITPLNADGIGRSFWVNVTTPLADVGTDSGRFISEFETLVKLPELLRANYVRDWQESGINAEGNVPANKLRATLVRDFVIQMFGSAGILGNRLEMFKAAGCRKGDRVQTTAGYKSRSLEGIALTAPYLHNSSVPSLDALFRPASERPKSFYVGCRKYDVATAGYDCRADSPNAFLVDTTIPGYGNQGHEYGTDFPKTPEGDADRAALIEFLKSIERPERPSLGACAD